MRLLVSLEARFVRCPDGSVWANANFGSHFWKRYLEVFDEVIVLGRVADTTHVPASHKRVDTERIHVRAIPYYVGPVQFLARSVAVAKAAHAAVKDVDVAIVRAPSLIGSFVVDALVESGKPFGLEVVGDPHGVFAPGAVRHPLRRLFRTAGMRRLRRMCRSADAVSYVSQMILPDRYPARPGALSICYSDIELKPDAFVSEPKRIAPTSAHQASLVTVGSLEQLYKGTDILIDALARCRQKGIDLRLTVVGDGRHRPELEQRAERLGVKDVVHFAGHVPAGAAVREYLDQADLFVLPSRTEGLPRALLEAMARSLPCIGSYVGGIPELLPDSVLVPPGDVNALTSALQRVLQHPSEMRRLSMLNLAKAKEYRIELLHERRTMFYETLAAHTRKKMGRVT
jgi:glycosyltransferase involved in cell wall biosynthesis